MALRFSEHGPAFPAQLVDALLLGETVFVCGAGVSAPQLPGFAKLVDEVFNACGLVPDAGERRAKVLGRFEEALGSLSRRLVHTRLLDDAVATSLALPNAPDLANHEILLRLSRDRENRHCLVTTNFDLMFEQAIAMQEGVTRAAEVSVAGQALPAPGAENFAGIIHLHGRLAEPRLGVAATPLVLTSAEYGDAYMRSGWAARFLFDLARCKTLVLVGYSANDAPVRYFLNILAADRARFTDLRPVYALDSYENEPRELDANWSTIAVEPIPFRKTEPGVEAYAGLWRDLGRLADLAERPKRTRHALISEVVRQPLAQASADQLEAVDWLLRGRGDLWIEILEGVEDPAWFEHFTERELWQDGDRDRLMAAWCSRTWNSRRRLYVAANTLLQGRIEFARVLDNELLFRGPEDLKWRRAWRVLVSTALRRLIEPPPNDYQLGQHLRSPVVLDIDLRGAVAALTPAAAVKPPYLDPAEDQDAASTDSLRDLFSLSLGSEFAGETYEETLTALLDRPADYPRLATLASAALSDTVALALEIDLLQPWDTLDGGVPSIADHPQNEYHGGVGPLVRLLTGVLPTLAQDAPQLARDLAGSWRALPSAIGVRLWLHTLSLPALFSTDEVAEAIAGLPASAFWAHQPEPPRLLQARYGTATPAQRQAVIDRIRAEGPSLFSDEEAADEGARRWVAPARQHAMWVRLMALREAGALTADGEALLTEIRTASPYLDRELEEQDFFSSYSSEVRSVTGDPKPLIEAGPDNRLELAHTLSASSSFEARFGWSAFCRAEPEAAFATLSGSAYRDEDAPLWRGLLDALWQPGRENDSGAPTRAAVLPRIFQFLANITNEQAAALGTPLVDAFKLCPPLPKRQHAMWWDRLWRASEIRPDPEPLADRDRFFDRVINSAPGKLAEILLRTMEREKDAHGQVSPAQWKRLRQIFESDTNAGLLGRGACAQAISYLVYLDEKFVLRRILPALTTETEAGAVLRTVVAVWSRSSPHASRLLKPVLLRAALDLRAGDGAAQQIAAKLLLPLFRQRLANPPEDWGFADVDVRHALTAGADTLRAAAAHVLFQWQQKPGEEGPAEFWRNGVKPVFQAVWPMEKRCLSTQTSRHLAAVSVAAQDAFPDAMRTVAPFLTLATDRSSGLYFLYRSEIPRQFPRETLELLWALLRNVTANIGSPELGKALDEIKAAEPGLEIDRRFQWLEARATRYV